MDVNGDPLRRWPRFALRRAFAGGGEGFTALVADLDHGGVERVLKVLDDGVAHEGSLAASLQHPQIPRVLESGRTPDGRTYLLREYVAGEPLHALLPLTPAEAVRLARELLLVLGFVHLRGILHLDLKPANVLRRAGADAGVGAATADATATAGAGADATRYVLFDFGLGRRGRGEARGGTPFYAAPELLLGLDPDARADLFSLGALLVAALRGEPRLPLARFLQRFPRHDFFDAAGLAANELPPPFDTFVPRLVGRRPSERFLDAQEALEALTGGGRPSLSLLRPDAIALHGARVQQALAPLGDDDEAAAAAPPVQVRVRGGDPAERDAVALHVACTLAGAAAACRDGEDRVVERTGERAGERVGATSEAPLAIVIPLPPLDERTLAAHLESAVGLDPASAEAAARHLLAQGAATPAAVERTLVDLVRRGRIVPDGVRWLWPDAAAGRLVVTTAASDGEPTPPADDDLDCAARARRAAAAVLADAPASPAVLRDAAAAGLVEGAIEAWRRAAMLSPGAEDVDRDLRQALAEGLLLAGEPARALLFAPDLPLLRARALLGTGQVREARAMLHGLHALHALHAPAAGASAERELARLEAELAFAAGDAAGAAASLHALVRATSAPRDRTALGGMLVATGRLQEAAAMLVDAHAAAAAARQPFVAAAALANLGEAERRLGRLAAAAAAQRRALALYQALGNARHVAATSSNLGVIAKDLGRHDEARQHLRRARALYRHLGDARGAAHAEANLGILDLETGDAHAAARRLDASAAELRRLGAHEALPLVLAVAARAHARLGDGAGARALVAEIGGEPDSRTAAELALVHATLAAAAEPAPMPNAAPSSAVDGGEGSARDPATAPAVAPPPESAPEPKLSPVAPAPEPKRPPSTPTAEPKLPPGAPAPEPERPPPTPTAEPKLPPVAPAPEPERPSLEPTAAPKRPQLEPATEPKRPPLVSAAAPKGPPVAREAEPKLPSVAPAEPVAVENAAAMQMQPGSGDANVPREVFRTFLAVNQRLANEADLERAMRYLLDAAVTLTGGRVGYLLVARGDGIALELRSGEQEAAAAAFSRSLVHRAMQERRPLTAEDALGDRALVDMPSVRGLRVRSAICVPFSSAGGVAGALYVEHPTRPGVFGAPEKEHLEVLADQAAIAVDRMLHEERLAAELAKSRRDLAVASRSLPRRRGTVTMIGKSEVMAALRKQVARVAASDLAVLVRGETGTGKELVARSIHQQSARSRGPFVAENVSAIPAELIESELFGHVRGAFTGADEDRPGLMELAHGGTLFLDEIGDMPLALQAALLRALQEGAIRRVGGNAPIAVDFRLVTATHKDVPAMIARGEFRADLWYRIAAVEIVVPRLQDRGDDVTLLAAEFLARLNAQHRREVRFAEVALAALREYPWPGNVRELEHVVARAFLLADADVVADLGLPRTAPRPDAAIAAPGPGGALEDWPAIPLAQAEARTIRAALRATGGDKTAAAKLLGISRTALYEKLKRIAAP